MGWPSYLCRVLFARAPVLGLSFFVSVNADASDFEEHDSVYSYEGDCFAAPSEHGDAANADCGEERDC